jgi:O-acetyl-ADP-ribose deacetylase (regulator of RNase III)
MKKQGATMAEEKKVGKSTLRVIKGDITDTEVEAFVFYARPDLKLGTGHGNAIAVRGGPSIQKELDEMGTTNVGDAVVTEAGKLKAKRIVHAVGPAFLENDIESKLRNTVLGALKRADEAGINLFGGYRFYKIIIFSNRLQEKETIPFWPLHTDQKGIVI